MADTSKRKLTAAATSSNDTLSSEFSSWLRDNGVHTNSGVLALAQSPACGGLGFIAKRDVRKGEVLLAMKQHLLLSVPVALASEVGAAVYALLGGNSENSVTGDDSSDGGIPGKCGK